MRKPKQAQPCVKAFTSDPPTHKYKCSGCGKTSQDVWDVDGLEHYRTFGVVCGLWRKVVA